MKCWECWCWITAESKSKLLKSSWELKVYTYYRCTKKSKKVKCSQKVIRVENLEKQIHDILSSIEIIPEFKNWALDILRDEFANEVNEKIKQSENIDRTILLEERKLEN